MEPPPPDHASNDNVDSKGGTGSNMYDTISTAENNRSAGDYNGDSIGDIVGDSVGEHGGDNAAGTSEAEVEDLRKR